MSMKRVVVVGASLAGLRTAESLRRTGYDGRLTIIGDEPGAPYDRPPLSKQLLAGDFEADDVALKVADDLDATWVLGDRAKSLDLSQNAVATASGEQFPFDGLVIATGSNPNHLPQFDATLPNVHVLRTLDDAVNLRSALTKSSRVLIIGAGFIGVEVASTARAMNVDVVIASLDAPLAIAGSAVSETVSGMLRDHGVTIYEGRTVTEVKSTDCFEAAVFDDGSIVEADHVLVAVGAQPATGWLAGSGLDVANGVLCDAGCAAVGASGIVAVGDVLRWPNERFGGLLMRIEHWTNASESAATAALTLLDGPAAGHVYQAIPSFWSDHFGNRLQSVGMPALADRINVIEGSIAERRFVAGAYRDGKLVGGVAYNMARGVIQLRRDLAMT